MNTERKYLIGMYKSYTKQIAMDYACRDKITKRIKKKFAPYKKGDKVKYLPGWQLGGGYAASSYDSFKRFGIVISCEYKPGVKGSWQICVEPATKNFTEHGSNKSYEWLTISNVRKFKP